MQYYEIVCRNVSSFLRYNMSTWDDLFLLPSQNSSEGPQRLGDPPRKRIFHVIDLFGQFLLLLQEHFVLFDYLLILIIGLPAQQIEQSFQQMFIIRARLGVLPCLRHVIILLKRLLLPGDLLRNFIYQGVELIYPAVEQIIGRIDRRSLF